MRVVQWVRDWLYVDLVPEEEEDDDGEPEEKGKKDPENESDRLFRNVWVGAYAAPSAVTVATKFTDRYREQFARKPATWDISQDDWNALPDALANDASKEHEAAEWLCEHSFCRRFPHYKRNFVVETVPGDKQIILGYNPHTRAFTYYSNHSPSTEQLDTVARKYVCVFDCREVYVVMERELQKAEERRDAWIQAENARPARANANVFAQFKQYNRQRGSTRLAASLHHKSAHDFAQTNPGRASAASNTTTTTTPTTPQFVKAATNRFTRMGSLADFQWLPPAPRVPASAGVARRHVSFADFKRLHTG